MWCPPIYGPRTLMISFILELTPEEQAKRDKRLLKKEELSREHDKILAEIENHDKNSVNLALKKFVSPCPYTRTVRDGP